MNRPFNTLRAYHPRGWDAKPPDLSAMDAEVSGVAND